MVRLVIAVNIKGANANNNPIPDLLRDYLKPAILVQYSMVYKNYGK
jgi:hypothetical protein